MQRKRILTEKRAREGGNGNQPGSVAEMREPNKREGMMDLPNSSGMGFPVRLAKREPASSAPLTE